MGEENVSYHPFVRKYLKRNGLYETCLDPKFNNRSFFLELSEDEEAEESIYDLYLPEKYRPGNGNDKNTGVEVFPGSEKWVEMSDEHNSYSLSDSFSKYNIVFNNDKGYYILVRSISNTKLNRVIFMGRKRESKFQDLFSFMVHQGMLKEEEFTTTFAQLIEDLEDYAQKRGCVLKYTKVIPTLRLSKNAEFTLGILRAMNYPDPLLPIVPISLCPKCCLIYETPKDARKHMRARHDLDGTIMWGAQVINDIEIPVLIPYLMYEILNNENIQHKWRFCLGNIVEPTCSIWPASEYNDTFFTISNLEKMSLSARKGFVTNLLRELRRNMVELFTKVMKELSFESFANMWLLFIKLHKIEESVCSRSNLGCFRYFQDTIVYLNTNEIISLKSQFFIITQLMIVYIYTSNLIYVPMQQLLSVKESDVSYVNDSHCPRIEINLSSIDGVESHQTKKAVIGDMLLVNVFLTTYGPLRHALFKGDDIFPVGQRINDLNVLSIWSNLTHSWPRFKTFIDTILYELIELSAKSSNSTQTRHIDLTELLSQKVDIPSPTPAPTDTPIPETDELSGTEFARMIDARYDPIISVYEERIGSLIEGMNQLRASRYREMRKAYYLERRKKRARERLLEVVRFRHEQEHEMHPSFCSN